MNVETVTAFVAENRQPADYLYLLLDPLGDCLPALNIPSLSRMIGDTAMERVLRPDLAHDPDGCPMLVSLATPGQPVIEHLLALSADHASEDINHNKRYVCGWLLSKQPPAVIAEHLVQGCRLLSDGPNLTPAPWFEPIRLELLDASMRYGFESVLGPIRQWLCPLSWGRSMIFQGRDSGSLLDIPDLSRNIQHMAPLVNELLDAWRKTINLPLRYAPSRWKGDSPVPPNAATHAFRLVRDARQQGLRSSADILALCLHRVLIHPYLLQHPTIQQDVATAAAGHQALQARFETHTQSQWQNIALTLPPAASYS